MGAGGVPNRTIEVSYERSLKKKGKPNTRVDGIAKETVRSYKVDGMTKKEEQNEIEIIRLVIAKLKFLMIILGIGLVKMEKEVKNI